MVLGEDAELRHYKQGHLRITTPLRQKMLIPTWRFPNPYGGTKKSPRRDEMLPTWGRNETSEEMFLAYVENVFSLRGDLRIATWGLEIRD